MASCREIAARLLAPGKGVLAVEVLREVWPDELAGVAFLSGGQPPERATANLEAMQHHATPWPLTFSFGRAQVDPALAAWAGRPAFVTSGQEALAERIVANSAAVRRRTESTTGAGR